MPDLPKSKIGSPLVAAVEAAWHAIQRRHPHVPDVLVVIGKGSRRKRGHYHHDLWVSGDRRTAELFIAGQTFADGAHETFTTIMHEAVHGLAAATGVKDTSREGRYHNRRFASIAEQIGMTYPHELTDSRTGFSDVVMTAETVHRYAVTIEHLDRAIGHHLEQPSVQRSSGRMLKAVCACPRIIRASAEVLGGPAILCGRCGVPFTTGA